MAGLTAMKVKPNEVDVGDIVTNIDDVATIQVLVKRVEHREPWWRFHGTRRFGSSEFTLTAGGASTVSVLRWRD